MAEDITKLLPRCVEDKSPVCDSALLEPQRSLKAILQKDVDTRGLDKEKIKSQLHFLKLFDLKFIFH